MRHLDVSDAPWVGSDFFACDDGAAGGSIVVSELSDLTLGYGSSAANLRQAFRAA